MNKQRNLLSSPARIQVPWVKVTIGDYTFGVYSEANKNLTDLEKGHFNRLKRNYPNYVKNLTVKKINGQINTYTLNINYPVTMEDDPNFFEKVFSKVSSTRKIKFSYGDISMPTYVYKEEEAIITKVTQSFNLQGSSISYTVTAVSASALKTEQSVTQIASQQKVKPSDRIKELFTTSTSLQNTFPGMSINNLSSFIASDDKEVELESKHNISTLDYLRYLVECMIPEGTANDLSSEIYILTFYDATIEDKQFNPNQNSGPYFRVTKTSAVAEQSDAYELNIGFNNQTIVRSLNIENDESYSIYYDYQNQLHQDPWVNRINDDGELAPEYYPAVMHRGSGFQVHTNDQIWWSKVTQYPIKASITVQGLLRPAHLMQYIRLNIIFPGGQKHISSGLYIITQQEDKIDQAGYTTTLQMTRIGGDNIFKK